MESYDNGYNFSSEVMTRWWTDVLACYNADKVSNCGS